MDLVFHILHITENTVGVVKNFLLLKKVFKKYTLEQGSPNHSPRAKSVCKAFFIRPQQHFFNDEKLKYFRKTFPFGRMRHIPKQSHYVWRTALELLCSK